MFLYKHFVGGPETSELDDIARNLGFVLRTKRGAGYFLESFGLSDMGFRTPEEMVTTLSAEIAENVRLYEPRVEVVSIDEEQDDDGRRTALVVKLRLRSGDRGLALVVDLAKGTFDFKPTETPSAR